MFRISGMIQSIDWARKEVLASFEDEESGSYTIIFSFDDVYPPPSDLSVFQGESIDWIGLEPGPGGLFRTPDQSTVSGAIVRQSYIDYEVTHEGEIVGLVYKRADEPWVARPTHGMITRSSRDLGVLIKWLVSRP